MSDLWRSLFSPQDVGLESLGELHLPIEDEGDVCVEVRGVLWFRWRPLATLCPRQLILLRLLVYLAQVDRDVVVDFLLRCGGERGEYFYTYRARYEREYRLGIHIKIYEMRSWEAMSRAMLDWQSMESDEYFTQRRQQICEMAPPGTELSEEMVVSVTVRDEVMDEAIPAIAQFVKVSRRRQSPFVVQSITMDTPEIVNHGPQLMMALRQLLRDGVSITGLHFGSTARITGHGELVHTLQSALNPLGTVEDTSSQPVGAESIQITTQTATHTLISLTTAIAQSQTLRRVHLHAPAGDATTEHAPILQFWRWIAFALFSRFAKHRIEMLDVEADTLVRADVLREIAVHSDPVLRMFDPRLLITGPAQDTVADIDAGTAVRLMYDYTRVKAVLATWELATSWTGLRVLDVERANNTVSFVLPGWGECQVDLHSVVLRHNVSATAVRDDKIARGVPHLRLQYLNAMTAPVALDLLALVGSFVERLDIHEDEDDLNLVEFLSAAIERCQHLRVLDLYSTNLNSLTWLMDAYANGTCRIERLELRVAVEELESVHLFFDTLGDAKSLLATHLMELSFHIYDQVVTAQDRGPILASCVKMLATNWTLRECRAFTLSTKRLGLFEPTFTAFHGQPLKTRKGPLRLECKLAFLSALSSLPYSNELRNSSAHQHCDAGDLGNLLERIDSNVIANIFRFAAENECRVCVVEIPPRRIAGT